MGVLSSDSPRDIERNISRFKAFLKIKKSPTSDYDLGFLNKTDIERSEASISKSQNLVISDRTKIQYSLFWFANGNAFDKIALENLKKGDYKKALDVWKKCTLNKKVLKNNFSSFNNYSSLLLNLNFYLYPKDKINFDEIKNAIQLKYKLLSSIQFLNFSSLIGAENTSLSASEVKEMFSEDIIKILKNNFDNSKISELFQNIDEEIYQSFSSSLTKDPIQSISNAIEAIGSELEEDHERGIELGKKLIKLTFKEVKNLKELVGKENYEFQMICDKLANQIMECGIACYNKTYDHKDYISSYKYALSISYSEKTKTRANDAIKHCNEEKGKNICPKCNSNKVDKTSPRYAVMFKETERSWWSNTVKYNQLTLTLYFCKTCEEKMQSEEGSESWFTWIVGAIGLIWAWAGSGEWFFGLFAGLFALGLGSWIGGVIFSSNRDISDHPTVRKYLNEGWGFDQPGQ